MKGYIVYQTYRIIDNKAYVFLFGRLENNESFLTMSYYRPYFYIRKKDLNTAGKLENLEHEETEFKNFKNDPLIKIILDIPSQVPELRHMLEENEIETFESDIRFPTRFLIDHNIRSTLDIEGDYAQEETIDRVYNEPELKPCKLIPKLKILSLDIETSYNGKDLYSIALFSENYEKVLIKSNEDYKGAKSFKDEGELLECFKNESMRS